MKRNTARKADRKAIPAQQDCKTFRTGVKAGVSAGSF